MDSKKYSICKIFTFVMLFMYLRSSRANNIDCEGKPFHCVNSTYFMICVDLGAGISKTVDNFLIQCPAMTECSKNNQFECEYRLPTTTQSNIHLDDETTDLTIDTQIFTISSNDTSNRISPIANKSITGFSDENINTIDGTTNENYLSDVQISNQSKVLENTETVTKDYQLAVYNLTSTNKTNAIESVDYLEINNQNSNESLKLIMISKDINENNTVYFSTQPEEVSSKQSFVTKNGIENVANVSNGTDNNNNKIDLLHYTTPHNEFKNASKLMVQEINNFRKTSTQATEVKNSGKETTFFLQNFVTTQTPPLTLNPTTTSKIENIKTKLKLDQVGQRLHKLLVENSHINVTASNPTQVKNLGTPKENISDINSLGNTDSYISIDTSTTAENKIELSTDFDLIGQLAQEKAISNSPYELNVSDVTENYNFVSRSFTVEPTVIPTVYMVETKQTIVSATESNDNFKHNVTFSEGGFPPTTLNPIILENKVINNITSKSAINEIKLNSFNYLLASNNLTTVPGINLTEKKLQEMVTESVTASSHAIYINPASPDIPFELTSTLLPKDVDHTILSTEYQTTRLENKLLKQRSFGYILNMSTLHKEHVLELPVLGNISNITGKRYNVPANITFNLTNVELTTSAEVITILDSTSKSTGLLDYYEPNAKNITTTPTEYMVEMKQTIVTTTEPSDHLKNNGGFPEGGVPTTTLNSIILENLNLNNVTSKSAINEIKLKSLDYTLPSNNLTTVSDINLMDNKLQETVTDNILASSDGNYVNTASPDVLLELTSTLISENFEQAILSTAYQTTIPETNLLTQKPYDNTSYMSPLQEEHILQVPVLSNISTIKGKALTVPANITFNLTYVDLTTSTELKTPLDSTFKSMKLATRIKEALRTTTSSYHVNDERILQKDNARQLPPDVGTTSSVLNLLQFDYYEPNAKSITELETIMTTPLSKLENTTFRLGQSIEVTVTENAGTFLNTTELSTQEEDVTQITSLGTENYYIHGSSGVENKTLISDSNLEEQIIRDINVNTSSPHDNYIFEIFFPTNITITNTESPYLPVKFSSNNLTHISSVTTFEQAAVDQVTSRKEMIESTTLIYPNERNTNARKITSEEAVYLLNLTQPEYHRFDEAKTVINETLPLDNHEESSSKSSIHTLVERILYDKTLMTTPGNYSTLNTGKFVSNFNFNKSTSMLPESKTTATFNNVSDFKTTRNHQFKDAQLPENSLNINTTPRFHNGLSNKTSSNSTENSKTSKDNILAQNLIHIDLYSNHVNLDQVTIDKNKSSTTPNNDKTGFGVLQYHKGNEMVKGIDKMTWENESYNTTNELYYMGQVTPALNMQSIDINKVTTEVTVLNQQTFNDNLRLTLQNEVIQSTEKSKYNFTNLEVFVKNRVTIPPTSASSQTTLVSNVDEIQSNYDLIATQYSNSLSTEIPNMVGSTVNNINAFIEMPDSINKNNKDQDQDKDYIEDKTLEDKVKNTLTTKSIVLINEINNINVSLFVDPDNYDFSLNKSLPTLKNMKPKHEIEIDGSPVEKYNSTEIPSDIRYSITTTSNATRKITVINVTNNFTNKSSDIQSFDYFNDSNSRKGNSIINSDNITATPTSDSNIIVLHTVNSNKSMNNFHSKTKQSNTGHENSFSNKRSVIVNDKTPLYDSIDSIEKSKTIYNDRPTTDKIILTAKIASYITTNSTSKSYLYLENDREHNILDKHNSSRTMVNNKFHNKLNRSIGDLGSVITESQLPMVPALLENINKDSLNAKLTQTSKNDGPYIRSTHGSKVEATHYTNSLTIATTTTPVNNRIIATKKSGSQKILNVSMKVNQSSTNIVPFRCNNRSRGRFADKNNCTKFYICFGRNYSVVGGCPSNTVFSEIKKQCTKNLSHCIRNNQFRCIEEGRFSDVLRNNIYYICVNKNNSFVRFQFRCQNGFQLNKTSIKCVKYTDYKLEMTSVSMDNDSNKGSNQSRLEHTSKEKKLPHGHSKYYCKAEGKFPDKEDCRRYYVCSKNSKSVFRRRTKKCDSDEIFHREKKKCVDRDSYECK